MADVEQKIKAFLHQVDVIESNSVRLFVATGVAVSLMRENARLREALEKYADHSRWICATSTYDWWQGENDADNAPGWQIAEETLRDSGA